MMDYFREVIDRSNTIIIIDPFLKDIVHKYSYVFQGHHHAIIQGTPTNITVLFSVAKIITNKGVWDCNLQNFTPLNVNGYRSIIDTQRILVVSDDIKIWNFLLKEYEKYSLNMYLLIFK